MERSRQAHPIQIFVALNLGVALMSIGFYFFKAPNGFVTGGVSGISVVLSRLFPSLSQGACMVTINILLLIVGIIVLGKDCGLRTVFCSLMFSAEIWALEFLVPLSAPLTDQPFLELVYAILLTGIGSALVFRYHASSGGTDIAALILKKYTGLHVGYALLFTDFLIVCSNFLVSGLTVGLFSMLGLFAKAFLIDNVIEMLNLCKAFTVITSRPTEIERYIMEELRHGVTRHNAVGEYTGEQKSVLMAVCKRAEANRLKRKIEEIDPNAFVIVTNSGEILGRGFRGE